MLIRPAGPLFRNLLKEEDSVTVSETLRMADALVLVDSLSGIYGTSLGCYKWIRRHYTGLILSLDIRHYSRYSSVRSVCSGSMSVDGTPWCSPASSHGFQ